MENRKEEFLKIVCQSYLIVILAVLLFIIFPGMDIINWVIPNITCIAMFHCFARGSHCWHCVSLL